jgi:hypothetical protein
MKLLIVEISPLPIIILFGPKFSPEDPVFINQSFYFSNIKVIPFEIVPLGSYTPMETFFPFLVTVLQVLNRYGLQHVRYTLLNVL